MTVTPLYWIEAPWTGRLAISARPRGGEWLEDEIAGWGEAGVRVVTSLLTPEEADELELQDEARVCAKAALRYFSLAIPDREIPGSDIPAIDFIQRLARELEFGKSVVIHCRQGVGRSGMIAAAVLSAGGVEIETALRRIAASRGLEVPETAAQLAWVRHAAEVLAQPTARQA
jgi:protein-tyrosine phosphatase